VQAHRLLAAGEKHEPAVTSLVAVAVSAVERLVQIPDEVHHELQRLDALFLRRLLVREHLGEPVDRVDDVVAGVPVALRVVPLRVDRDAHVVPRRRFVSLPPDLVGPTHDLGIGEVGIIEQFLYPDFRLLT
jgi:hypothetical protein